MGSPWGLVYLTAFFFGLYNIFTRAAGPKIGGLLGPLLLEGFAALVILAFFLWRKYQGAVETVTTMGVVYSLAAGLSAAAGSIVFFLVFSRGGQLSLAGSSILVGSALLTVAGGFLFFREPLTLTRFIGIAFGLISLYLLRLE